MMFRRIASLICLVALPVGPPYAEFATGHFGASSLHAPPYTETPSSNFVASLLHTPPYLDFLTIENFFASSLHAPPYLKFVAGNVIASSPHALPYAEFTARHDLPYAGVSDIGFSVAFQLGASIHFWFRRRQRCDVGVLSLIHI